MNKKRAFKVAIFLPLVVPHVLFLLQPFFQDEWVIIQNTIKFFSDKTIIPYHAGYPTFYSYLVAPFVGLGAYLQYVFGDYSSLEEAVIVFYKLSQIRLILPARIISVLLFFLFVAFYSFYTSKRCCESSGLAIAALLLTAGGLLQYPSYGLPDVAVLTFSALSLVCSMEAIRHPRAVGAFLLILVSAGLAGLAVSSKYNAVSATLPIGCAAYWLYRSKRITLPQMINMLLGAAYVCVAFFLLGTPGWVLKPDMFLSGLLAVATNLTEDVHFGATGFALLGHAELILRNAPVISLFGCLGFCLFVVRRDGGGFIAFVSVLASVLLATTMTSRQTYHYLFPALPGLVLFCAHSLRELFRSRRNVTWLVLCLVIAITTFDAYRRSLPYLRPSTLAISTRWIYDNIPEGSRVASDWGYVPKIYSLEEMEDLSFGDSVRYERNIPPYLAARYRREMALTHRPYDVITLERTDAWLANTKADWFVTSSGVYKVYFESGCFTGIEPRGSADSYAEYHEIKTFYESLFHSEAWEEVLSVRNGNGPHVRVFRRRTTNGGAGTPSDPRNLATSQPQPRFGPDLRTAEDRGFGYCVWVQAGVRITPV